MLSFKTAIRLTNSLIRKFRDIKLMDSDDQCLPPKKRKLTENPNHVSLDFDAIFQCFLLDLPIDFDDEKVDIIAHITSIIEYTRLVLTNPEKTVCSKRYNLITKKTPRIKIKSNWKSSVSKELQHEVTIQQLISLFQNSVNIILPKGYDTIEDIDCVVRSFSYFGKVLSIQDHWIRPPGFGSGPPSLWLGAMVTYKNEESCHRVLRTLSVLDTPFVGVSVADHLIQIHRLESSWTSSRGTCIVLHGPGSRDLRTRFAKEFSRYGTVRDLRWRDRDTAEVTYASTTSAVAAALALDGRNLFRCHLRTEIRVREKELYIHRKLRETF